MIDEGASESPVRRSSVATPEDVRRRLSTSEGELEELRRDQLLQLSRSRARLSPGERRIARGIELERHHRLTGNRDGLAEALRLQGRYREAAEVAEDAVLGSECLEYADAVDRADDDCPCDNFARDGEYAIPNQYVEAYGHSAKHGRDMPFVRCRRCGVLNARPMPKHLDEQRRLRRSGAEDEERRKFFKVRK